MFKKSPEALAAKEAQRQHAQVAREQAQAAREREQFLNSPVGRAQTAYDRGDHVFQYSHDVVSQQAVIVALVGSTSLKSTTDPSAVLNAVCDQGWELVNGSFVFIHEGSQSRDKFMSSGQNLAVKGTVVGYYLFRRCRENRRADPEAPAKRGTPRFP